MIKPRASRTRQALARFKGRTLAVFMVPVGALILLALGAWLIYPWVDATIAKDTPPSAETIVRESTATPSEKAVPTDQPYVVPTDQPRQLILPSLNTSMFIQQVGLDRENRVAVPTNIHLAGWYVGSKKPGDFGVSVIDGHVSGRYKPGIFSRLHDLEKGDKVIVEFGDKTRKTFTVKATTKVSEKFAAPLLFAKRPSMMNQLNLITCAFGEDGRTYSDRVIVSAELDVELPVKPVALKG